MNVIVAETGGRHFAITISGECCEAGHADAAEAAGHAWKLTRALAGRQSAVNVQRVTQPSASP